MRSRTFTDFLHYCGAGDQAAKEIFGTSVKRTSLDVALAASKSIRFHLVLFKHVIGCTIQASKFLRRLIKHLLWRLARLLLVTSLELFLHINIYVYVIYLCDNNIGNVGLVFTEGYTGAVTEVLGFRLLFEDLAPSINKTYLSHRL